MREKPAHCGSPTPKKGLTKKEIGVDLGWAWVGFDNVQMGMGMSGFGLGLAPHSSQARQTAPIDGHTTGPIQQVVVHVAFGVILGRA